jgi:hypothetical protein
MGRASGSVSQRNEAQGHVTFDTCAPPSLRGYVRIPVELTSLKPEAAKKNLFPALIDRNQKRSEQSFLFAQTNHFPCASHRAMK